MDDTFLQDKFQRPGDDFEEFRRQLPDDCVEYIVYAVDGRLQDQNAVRHRLADILKRANYIAESHLEDFIWQREVFELKLYPNELDAGPAHSTTGPTNTPHLRGRTNFGDSITDEWLIVYLLLELSKSCPDAWIRVYDTDGEFLLIEAANVLPKWLNPDVADNRIWINNGHLRIIPLDGETPTTNIKRQEALAYIGQHSDKLIISPYIEDEAFHRLHDYPAAIQSSLHHALVSIPRSLACILHRNPVYVSPAVESFYLRDPISIKPLATKDISSLHFPPEDLVTARVKFTKAGYAQLRSQVFDPPPAWTGIIPRLRDQKVAIGMKLTCGFEMLLSDPQSRHKRAVREIKVLLENLEKHDELLPTDTEIARWPQTEDDEKWLDIDYTDFVRELDGGKRNDTNNEGSGFGDERAQENLRKMVSRFEDFLQDDTADADSVEEGCLSDDEDEVGSDEHGSERTQDYIDSVHKLQSDSEFERAMKETRAMSASQIESSGLLAEARRLAIEDAEVDVGSEEMEEDDEMKKVMEIMERELKSRGALRLNGDRASKQRQSPNAGAKKVVFGPERPPHMLVAKAKGVPEIVDDDVGPGDEELSSEDEDEDFNDVDVGLAQNLLQSFKGQAGMSGPAGNLMKALGVVMPRDEGGGQSEEEPDKTRVHEI